MGMCCNARYWHTPMVSAYGLGMRSFVLTQPMVLRPRGRREPCTCIPACLGLYNGPTLGRSARAGVWKPGRGRRRGGKRAREGEGREVSWRRSTVEPSKRCVACPYRPTPSLRHVRYKLAYRGIDSRFSSYALATRCPALAYAFAFNRAVSGTGIYDTSFHGRLTSAMSHYAPPFASLLRSGRYGPTRALCNVRTGIAHGYPRARCARMALPGRARHRSRCRRGPGMLLRTARQCPVMCGTDTPYGPRQCPGSPQAEESPRAMGGREEEAAEA
eukprot:232261-Rhodomonas_salina.1